MRRGRNSHSDKCARRARRLQHHTALGNQSSRCGVSLGSGLSRSQKYLGGLSRGFGRTHTLAKLSKRGMLRLRLMAVRFFLNGSLIMSALRESPAPRDGNGARGACPPGRMGHTLEKTPNGPSLSCGLMSRYSGFCRSERKRVRNVVGFLFLSVAIARQSPLNSSCRPSACE